MLISGIQKFTLLDYPGESACIIFTAGCNFRCGYCHNPEFVLPELLVKLKNDFIPEEAIFNFLETRRSKGGGTPPLLGGVVISGGEPTIQPDLLDFIRRVKKLGFKVKLDTNGNKPELIKAALAENLLDYVAMDYKTSLSEYQNLVGNLALAENIKTSIELLKSGAVDYEFRTTLLKEVHSDIILEAMLRELTGAKRLFLQQFRPGVTLNQEFASHHAFSHSEMQEIADKFKSSIQEVAVRE